MGAYTKNDDGGTPEEGQNAEKSKVSTLLKLYFMAVAKPNNRQHLQMNQHTLWINCQCY
jgi:hypothetical protein